MDSIILISYFPLLYSEPVIAGVEILDKFKSKIEESTKYGTAKGCIWTIRDGVPMPIFIMEQAKAISKHIHTWSEDKIEDWFEIKFQKKNGRYVLALIPRIQKSIERWKIQFQLQYGYPPASNLKFQILFQPLQFISGYNTVFEKLGDLPNPMRLGLIDPKDIDMDHPDNMDDKIIEIGQFKLAEPGEYQAFIDGMFEDEPSSQPSIIFQS